MAAGIFGIVFLIVAHLLVKWWEDENIDTSSGGFPGGGSIGSEVDRATEKRKNEKKSN
jgi:hypothetical protein